MKAVWEEEALITAKTQRSNTSKGHRQSDSIYAAQTSSGEPEGVKSGISPVIEALTQAVTQTAQSQSSLQQTFSEIQNTVGQLVQTEVRMHKSHNV